MFPTDGSGTSGESAHSTHTPPFFPSSLRTTEMYVCIHRLDVVGLHVVERYATRRAAGRAVSELHHMTGPPIIRNSVGRTDTHILL